MKGSYILVIFLSKKVKVEIDDGNKKVTVTTKENGEEKIEVYEGEEADEYLDKMKSEHGNEMLIEIDEDGNHKKMKKILKIRSKRIFIWRISRGYQVERFIKSHKTAKSVRRF